ncbi:MAG: hypothetical protein ACU0BS_04260, partial [Hasllibacter sp.]
MHRARRWGRGAIWALGIVAILWAALPLWNADLWWVRMAAFPRVQGLVLSVAAIALALWALRPGGARTALLLGLVAAAGLDAWRVWPVTAGAALAGPGSCAGPSIRVLTVNVEKN